MRQVAALVLAIALAAPMALAQNLAAPIAAGIDDMASGYDVYIPNYGLHGFIRMTLHRIEAVEARDLALPIFTALVAGREGTVSVTISAQADWSSDRYTLTLQRLDGQPVRVYLDGETFDP